MNCGLKAFLYILLCLRVSECFEMQQHFDHMYYSLSEVKPTKNNLVARIDGDLILGGLFSMHRRYLDKECVRFTSFRNIIRVEAMLYAVEEINNNTEILPNITLGAEIRDDCLSDPIALEESLQFVLHTFGQGGKICTNPNSRSPPVMGVVGTVSSQIAMTVASLLRLFRLPQISYGATSPDLSNRDEYEYFTRTVPSDQCQAEALKDIISQLGWSAVFLISSSGNYGERIREAFVRLAKNESNRLCIVDELKIGAPKGEGSLADARLQKEITPFLLKINERQSVRGVVLLTESFHTYEVLKSANNTVGIENNRFRWLGTDTWGTGQNVKDVENVANNAITIALHTPSSNALKNFHDYFRALRPGANSKNPWFDMFWEHYLGCDISKNKSNSDGRPQCNGSEAIGQKDEIWNDDKVPFVFDSVYAFAHSIQAMLSLTNSSLSLQDRLEQLSQNEINLLGYLMNTSFTGKSGRVSFDENGNGMPRYDIMNYVDGKYKKIAVWVESESKSGNITWLEKPEMVDNGGSSCGKECKIGEGRFNPPGDPPCCWQCQTCSTKQYVDSQFQCQVCKNDKRPNKNRNGCEGLPEEGPLLFVVVILTVWGCLGLVSTSFVAFTMYKFYSTPLIMASGRELMLVLLAGIALSFCLGFALLGSPSARRCVFQRFGSGVFLAVCYSAILVKTNRIARIFRGEHRPAFITPGPQLLITALLVSIQVGISLIASIFGTSSEVMAFYESDHVHMICRTSGMEYIISISYNVLLLLLCTVYAFLTRKLPANFNEAKLVGITMYTTCVQWICFIPLFYGTTPAYHTSVLLLNSCFNATVLLVGMFGQKVYVVWLRPEKNTRQASNPRCRMGSSTSASINMDDLANGNIPSEKGFCGCEMKRFSSKVTLESTVGVIEP